MADIVSIGIAYDTSQLVSGSRQVQSAMQQLTQAEKQTQTASEQLANSSTKTAQALEQEGRAASQSASTTQTMEQAARQAAQAMGQTLATAVSQAAKALIEAQREAKKAEEEIRKAKKAAEDAARPFGAMGAKLMELGRQALAFGGAQLGVQTLTQAFSTVRDAITGTVQSAIRLESLQATFKAISGSSQAAEKDLAFLRQTATRLGVDFTSLAKGYTTLSASAQNTTLSGAAMRDIFTAIAEKGRVLGKSAEDINGAMLAVGQSISKGTIQAEELRGQLSERLPGAFNDMARAMGVSTAELNKMLEAGNVGIENWKAWAAVVRADLGSATQEASQTASAALARLGNATGDLAVTLGQALLPALTSVVGWLTDVTTWFTKAARAALDYDEAAQKAAKRAKEEGGAGATPTQTGRIAELARQEDEYRQQRQRLEGWRGTVLGMGGVDTARQIDYYREQEREAQAERLRLEQANRQAGVQAREQGDPFGEGAEPGGRDEKRVKFEADLAAQVKKNREEMEQLHTVSQQLYGRKATEDEILKLREKQADTTVKLVQANQQLWNLYKDTGPAKALREQAAGSEALKKAMEAAEKAERDRKAAKTKADHDAKAASDKAKREQDQADDERKRLDKQQADEVTRTHFQSFQHLQRLADQYSSVKAARDADTASMLAASLATSQYAEKARELLAVLQASQKTEEKLPELRSEAKASAETLTDLQRLEKQLEPRRRSMSLAEHLAATRTKIETLPGLDEQGRREALARADAQIKEALDTEAWQTWRDFATESLDHVGDAITQFAFHGKLTFKDMVSSIAEDFFQMSLKILSQSALSALGGASGGSGAGGWVDLALKAGTSLLSAFGGGGAPMEGQPGFIGPPRRQGGGPVYAGQPYLVGEQGPELLVPRMNGMVLPHGQGIGGTTVINVNVHGVQDAQSFVASRGAVHRAIAGSVSQAYRGL
jgi:lambda family phage tail tape measure protein